MADVAGDGSAFSARDAAYCVNIAAAWDDPEETPRHTSWARQTHQALEPFARNDAYVNFMTEHDAATTSRAYRLETLERLRGLKARYDPQNVFHLNANIKPS